MSSCVCVCVNVSVFMCRSVYCDDLNNMTICYGKVWKKDKLQINYFAFLCEISCDLLRL